jgi:hypothetical protein
MSVGWHGKSVKRRTRQRPRVRVLHLGLDHIQGWCAFSCYQSQGLNEKTYSDVGISVSWTRITDDLKVTVMRGNRPINQKTPSTMASSFKAWTFYIQHQNCQDDKIIQLEDSCNIFNVAIGNDNLKSRLPTVTDLYFKLRKARLQLEPLTLFFACSPVRDWPHVLQESQDFQVFAWHQMSCLDSVGSSNKMQRGLQLTSSHCLHLTISQAFSY